MEGIAMRLTIEYMCEENRNTRHITISTKEMDAQKLLEYISENEPAIQKYFINAQTQVDAHNQELIVASSVTGVLEAERMLTDFQDRLNEKGLA